MLVKTHVVHGVGHVTEHMLHVGGAVEEITRIGVHMKQCVMTGQDTVHIRIHTVAWRVGILVCQRWWRFHDPHHSEHQLSAEFAMMWGMVDHWPDSGFVCGTTCCCTWTGVLLSGCYIPYFKVAS